MPLAKGQFVIKKMSSEQIFQFFQVLNDDNGGNKNMEGAIHCLKL